MKANRALSWWKRENPLYFINEYKFARFYMHCELIQCHVRYLIFFPLVWRFLCCFIRVLICLQPPLIKPTDNQLSLADIDTIKVIGKGAGGTVQLVQHKWTGQFFALKVL